MDPRATLLQLEAAINGRCWAEAVQALGDYYRWRLGGGYAPMMSRGDGDYTADMLAARLADRLEGVP